MNVIIDSKVYQDGQKIKWNEYGDIIYGTIQEYIHLKQQQKKEVES